MKRLTDRQRELLGYVVVTDNVAVFARDEIIPDWKALKAVMVALGGKWKTKKGFFFPDDTDAAELVRLAAATGEILDPRAADYFPTPHWLADGLVHKAQIPNGAKVLEPSAGRGAIVAAVLRPHADAAITAVEALPANVAAYRASHLPGVRQADFLTLTARELGTFDRVVMNPPFSARADIHHVRHAFGFLRPGGRLVAIMSAGVAFRQDRVALEFRALVASGKSGRIEPNPEGAFLESGTGARTVTVVMEAA
jgi:phospholipid N-methyltransferase